MWIEFLDVIARLMMWELVSSDWSECHVLIGRFPRKNEEQMIGLATFGGKWLVRDFFYQHLWSNLIDSGVCCSLALIGLVGSFSLNLIGWSLVWLVITNQMCLIWCHIVLNKWLQFTKQTVQTFPSCLFGKKIVCLTKKCLSSSVWHWLDNWLNRCNRLSGHVCLVKNICLVLLNKQSGIVVQCLLYNHFFEGQWMSRYFQQNYTIITVNDFAAAFFFSIFLLFFKKWSFQGL